MNDTNDDGEFPGHLLHQASLWDNAELLIDILRGDLGSQIESQDSWGRTALHSAATTQDSRCLQVLLEHGANPNAVSGGKDNFKTALHTSAEHGFLSNVKRLVVAGADVLSLEGRALTAADLALRGEHIETYNFLMTISRDKEAARERLHASLRDAVTQGDVHHLSNLLRPLSAADKKELLNKTPHGTNSLLFKACESGNMQLVDILLENGSDGRIHPVTKYSPLYIAAYHGHRAIVSKLLTRFPGLAKSQTVEKWLPLHASCINGHAEILDLLLNFNYPTDLLYTFRVQGKEDEYEMAFDINQKDVSDQSSLYIACQMGNRSLVDVLLKFRLPKKGSIISEATSPTKGKVSQGIQGIISRLSLASSQPPSRKDLICPIDVNLYSEAYQTSLHVAVKARNYSIASSLLAAGADPNLPILAPTSTHIITTNIHRTEERPQESSALAEACKNRDLGMIDLLLKHGARDEDSKALLVASSDDIILGKLLTLKAYADPEGILDNTEIQQRIRDGCGKKPLATSLLPKFPVNINWHGQRLSKISEAWLISAGLKLNPKLRLAPRESMGLQAITRLDLSNNNLDSIPSSIFKLSSLIYLNLSGNKITKIILPSPSSHSPLPQLQEFLLQENRIEQCPTSLFTEFPSLIILNLSNNKLDSLPASMWLAPKLQDLNASLNLISDLPQGPRCEGLASQRKSSMESIQGQRMRRSSSRKSSESVSHEAMWRRGSGIIIEELDEELKLEVNGNTLLILDMSHNSFLRIPTALACCANRIQRLNLAFNSLEEMGPIGDYPSSLRSLDLSHNRIHSWFSANESEGEGCCGDVSACPHHTRFRRLDNLKTLLLGGNALTGLEVSFEEQGPGAEGRKALLWFPNLSMLDLSENKLNELSPRVASLSQLSVLNLSGNKDLGELPPQLGLLSRIWNLNFQGCNLTEPLKSLVERKGSKTVDIVGYLKSVFEDAKPYARMKLMVVGVHGIGKTSLLSLLRQEGSGKGSDTWAKRMANTPSKSGKSGKLMSTVGVDIGSLVLEKGNKGPVTFYSWDFGGQREYYATHSYFLSKRSLYLVLWNICDGEKGLNEVNGWLVNIQARAPNSPVIIVGTHFDLVSEKFPPGYLDYLEQKIRDKFICVSDPEKRGLPRVLTTLNISCRTRHNIKYLSTVIYDAAVTLKTSNGKFLLEQRVPSKYIHLEEIVSFLATERKNRGQDPVLTEAEFKMQAASWLETSYGVKFRDDAEIIQACSFLHENGILLHYEDSTLRDLYFLDPQWLCDMLANVVTIREINPFAQGGSMRVQDLAFLFKGRSKATQDYILVLLSKFELAIPYDGTHLLIPSLLPTLDQMKMGHNEVRVKVAVRSRGWMLRNRGSRQSGTFDPPMSPEEAEEAEPVWRTERKQTPAITRFLLLSYFPSGFWPRLMSRILSDDRMIEILRHYFQLPPPNELTTTIVAAVDRPAEWFCWQTGLELRYGELTLIRIKEIASSEKPHTFMLRRDEEGDFSELADEKISVAQEEESVWDVVDLLEAGLLEIHLPCLSLSLDSDSTVVLNPTIESLTKLLTLGVEAVDNLLEDWYPSIGTRFVHTSEGKYLVTRLCPCPSCFPPAGAEERSTNYLPRQLHSKSPRKSTDSGMGHSPTNTCSEVDIAEMGSGILRHRTGIAFETPKFGNVQSAGLNFFLRSDSRTLGSMTRNYYAWTVEHCILQAQASTSKSVKCPKHGDIQLAHVAPDILFYDLPKRYLLNVEDLVRKQLLGRGAFGFVFSGILKGTLDVAIKTFHPIDPGDGNEEAQTAYKAAKTKWCRAPTQSACRAYLASRGEIRVLYWVSHPNIVPLLGVLQSSLSIVMPRAPRGALDSILADFGRSGDLVAPVTVQQSILQMGKALEYLHGHKIIYRDLKAENILVWSFPPPFSTDLKMVDLKLADYGISRCSLPTGNKGFGGTEGFMAPEIIRFNGEEEYTEKVDTFSLGMVIYQMLSLKQPFDGCENIKESILEGLRPSLRQPERYPVYILDLMVACWDNQPKDRPTASQLLEIASSAEFTLLRDVVSVGTPPGPWELNVVTSVGLDEEEVWATCSTGTVYSLHIQNDGFSSCEAFAFIPGAVTAMCRIQSQVWMGDIMSKIHIFQLEGERTSREVELEPLVGDNLGACISIQPVGCLAAVAFSSGRLFLLDGISGMLVTELGKATTLHSLAARTWADSDDAELWTGEKGGEMRIFSLVGGNVVGQETICHLQAYQGETSLEGLQVLLINTHPKKELLFSYVFPGSVIYSWNGDRREMVARLDVGKLLPKTDSQETLLSKSVHLTVLHSTEDFVFIGTNTGFIFLVGVDGLHHLSTFHPFSKDVRSFWVSPPALSETMKEEDDQTSSPSPDLLRGQGHALTRFVAFGKNYVHPFDSKAQEQRRAYAVLYCLNNN